MDISLNFQVSSLRSNARLVSWQEKIADPLTFRIGINLGDVIVEDDDLFGEGINVAARLEALRILVGFAFPRMHGVNREEKLRRILRT